MILLKPPQFYQGDHAHLAPISCISYESMRCSLMISWGNDEPNDVENASIAGSGSDSDASVGGRTNPQIPIFIVAASGHQ